MNGIGTLLIVAVVMYLLFSRTGGIGCCGGHSQCGASHREPENKNMDRLPPHRVSDSGVDLKPMQNSDHPKSDAIIDLRPEDDKVISDRSI